MLDRYHSLLVVATLLTLSPLISASEKETADAAKLIGTWRYVSGQKNGEKLGADHFKGQTIVITKDTLTLKSSETFVMKYELDAKQKPMSVKLTITAGPFGTGATTAGILELEGDELKLCYAPRGGAAPDKFEAAEDSGYHLFTLQRMEERLEAEKLVGVWGYASGQKDGETLDENHFKGQTVAITKDTFTLKGEATFVMKYELETKQQPASIKFTMTESPFGAGATANGILQLKAGKLSVCYAPMGGPPPAKFEAQAGSGHFLFVLKRSDKQ